MCMVSSIVCINDSTRQKNVTSAIFHFMHCHYWSYHHFASLITLTNKALSKSVTQLTLALEIKKKQSLYSEQVLYYMYLSNVPLLVVEHVAGLEVVIFKQAGSDNQSKFKSNNNIQFMLTITIVPTLSVAYICTFTILRA